MYEVFGNERNNCSGQAKGKGPKPPVTEKSVRGGRGVTPLSVNFFPLTFWVKNSVFLGEKHQKIPLAAKFFRILVR